MTQSEKKRLNTSRSEDVEFVTLDNDDEENSNNDVNFAELNGADPLSVNETDCDATIDDSGNILQITKGSGQHPEIEFLSVQQIKTEYLDDSTSMGISSETEQTLLNSSTGHKTKVMKCNFCQGLFKNRVLLNGHTCVKPRYKCKQCPFRAENFWTLSQHSGSVHSGKKSKKGNKSFGSRAKEQETKGAPSTDESMKKCKTLSDNKTNEDAASLCLSGNSLAIKCRICNKMFDNKVLLNRHTCLKLKYKCKKCPFRTQNYWTLGGHVRHKHRSGRINRDDTVVTSTRPNIERNNISDSTSQKGMKTKLMKCNFCKGVFRDRALLNGHKCVKPRYKCKQCPFRAENVWTLARHNRLVHTRKSETVGAGFQIKQENSSEDLETPEDANATINKYKHIFPLSHEFRCQECQFVASSATSLAKHQWVAHPKYKARPVLTCPTCKKSYKSEVVLKRHIDVECGRDPEYECSFCENMFYHEFMLNKHVLQKHSEKSAGSQ